MLTQAQLDEAYRVLEPIYEPMYQSGCATVILSGIKEAVDKHMKEKQGELYLTSWLLQELDIIAKEVIVKYLNDTNYYKNLPNKRFMDTLAVSFNSVGSTLNIVPNDSFRMLDAGNAPVTFFNHPRDVIENMWKDHKEKNPA